MKQQKVTLILGGVFLLASGMCLFAQNTRTRSNPARRPAATVRPAPVSRPASQARRVPTPTRRPLDPPSVRPRFDDLKDEIAHIRRGIHGGQLTRQEVGRLKQELETVKAHQQRALLDGALTPHEKEILQNEINKLDRHIYQQLHDDQTQAND